MRQRFQISVEGLVQGVGFRPFVYGLATKNGLGGFVLNDSLGLTIELEGESLALDHFLQSLHEQAPPSATIERIACHTVPPQGEFQFQIVQSNADVQRRRALISADMPTCNECLDELFDPQDRRYRYPFINCTQCGPRFTIIEDVPYDRERTTMSLFQMCGACEREYHDPADRRFHAQPNACPKCGPELRLLGAHGDQIARDKAISCAADLLLSGAILAIKGLGGYHLACNAFNQDAAVRLRRGKHREDKPFALMARDVESVRALCHVSLAEDELLRSRRRPIVLLRRYASDKVAASVAPGQRYLGVMLPYAPLHHLLLGELAEPLVMTSGNVSEEPIAYEDVDAEARLSAIADYFLSHNRDIHMRCDDSVTRICGNREFILRRSRGHAPEPLRLRHPFLEPTLACGAQMKNTFCLGKGDYAFLSHHIGDLENYEAFKSFVEGIEHFKRLFDSKPTLIAHDLHPEYLSTKYAIKLSGVIRVPVQHHHAHIASCMAEHGLEGPVIGVAFDGLGYGSDGTLWGGEFLIADLARFERRAHLRAIPLAGGDTAIREPWRAAVSYLNDACDTDPRALPGWTEIALKKIDSIQTMMNRGVNTIRTSSCGRLFDAVASIIGLRHYTNYEGQAAIELEMAVLEGIDEESYPFDIGMLAPWEVDMRQAIRAIVRDVREQKQVGWIAAKFHNTVISGVVEVCRRLRETDGFNQVCLSGGTFQNMYLLQHVTGGLRNLGFEVYSHSKVPSNDGGIALGQAVVANERMRRGG